MRRLIATLALAILGADPAPAPPPAVDVAAMYGADPRWGKDPKAIDSADAIQAALDANPRRVLYLAPGSYYCSHELTIRSTQSLVGDPLGAAFRMPTVLAFANGSRGIVVLDDPKSGGAQETRIENLVLWGLYKNSPLPAKFFVPGEDGVTPMFVGPPGDGIDVQAGVRLRNLRVTGFRRHGIWIHAGVPRNTANLWRIDDCQVDTCGLDVPDDGVDNGDGLSVLGGDANGGVAIGLSCTANRGYGIRDDSGLGNTYISAHTRTNGVYGTTQGGAYRVGSGGPGKSGVNASVLISCYQEGDQPTSVLGDQVFVLGGTIAGPIRGGQMLVTGNARLRLQSGGGVVPPVVAMGNRNLTGPVLATANWAGGTTAAFSQDGTLSLGLAPGEVVPGQGQSPPPRLSIWGTGDQPAIRFGATRQGYVAPIGDVVASADGAGYGSGYTAFRTVGAGGKLAEALRLQQGNVAVGAGGLTLPSLSKADRAKLRPKAGTLAFDADAGRVVVFDGQAWHAMPWGD